MLDRQSGQPLVHAIADLYQREYDYKTSRYTKKKLGTYNTDAQGYFSMTSKKDNRNNFLVDISYKGDRLNDDEEIYNYNPGYPDQEILQVKKISFTPVLFHLSPGNADRLFQRHRGNRR